MNDAKETTESRTSYPTPWTYSWPDIAHDWGFVRDADGMPVCRVSVGGFSEDVLNQYRKAGTDPTAEVARVLAAADDMFNALRWLKDDLETFRESILRNEMEIDQDAINPILLCFDLAVDFSRAEAALAKARGEA